MGVRYLRESAYKYTPHGRNWYVDLMEAFDRTGLNSTRMCQAYVTGRLEYLRASRGKVLQDSKADASGVDKGQKRALY